MITFHCISMYFIASALDLIFLQSIKQKYPWTESEKYPFNADLKSTSWSERSSLSLFWICCNILRYNNQRWRLIMHTHVWTTVHLSDNWQTLYILIPHLSLWRGLEANLKNKNHKTVAINTVNDIWNAEDGLQLLTGSYLSSFDAMTVPVTSNTSAPTSRQEYGFKTLDTLIDSE